MKTPLERIISALDATSSLQLDRITFDGDRVVFEMTTQNGSHVIDTKNEVDRWFESDDTHQRQEHPSRKEATG